MNNWSACGDLGEPQLWVAITLDYWDKHEAEIRAWFRNEGKDAGQVFGEGAVYVNSVHEPMFLLRFGP